MSSSTTVSWREFNEDTSHAKKLAAKGPVFITDRGKPSYVLLTVAQYRQLAHARGAIAAPGRKYRLADLVAQCDLTAAPPADIEEWQSAPAVGRELL